jgi:Zn-dependent peptidase ImmA (M78 family)
VEYVVLFKKPHGKHFDEADGVCYSPEDKRPRIYINPYLGKQSELNTCIHEFAHAFFWEETERNVASFANALSRFLYQECSWRKIERSGKRNYKGK